MNYLVICFLAIGIGFVDVAIKAFWAWTELPSFVQGCSWHIFLFLVYAAFLWLIGFIRRFDWKQYIGGLLLWINEDVIFYMLKSIFTWNSCWNDWFFPSFEVYLFTIIGLNLFAYLLLKERSSYAR